MAKGQSTEVKVKRGEAGEAGTRIQRPLYPFAGGLAIC